MDKKIEFLEHVIALCYDFGLCIASDDSYEGIDVVEFDSDNKSMYKGLYHYLKNG